jgi:hypothetical protein
MKDYKTLLISLVEVVTFLLASFGGFLKNIAPPDQVGANYSVGIMSFLLLIVLLVISAVARNLPDQSTSKRWLGAGSVLFCISVCAGLLYPYLLSNYTYPHQTELSHRQIGAPDKYLTSDARQYKAANPSAGVDDLLQNLPDGDVWSSDGIERTSLLLLISYMALVLALAGAIFCLLEANLRARGKQEGPAESTLAG